MVTAVKNKAPITARAQVVTAKDIDSAAAKLEVVKAPAAKPAIKAAVKPATKSATKPATKRLTKPASKPANKVGAKAAVPAIAAAVKPATVKAKPATKTVAKPAAKVTKSNAVKPISATSSKEKHKKPKLVRDSFTMPEAEYSVLGEVKKACIAAGVEVKKSQLLRVGLVLLKGSSVATLKAMIEALPALKAGRPKAEK
ncbi:hypothetical protein [Undibacterium sp. Di24W]|uniref:hypothetical protein n=1 Tax=Undibacterium sp. Di24W TaxID=3413033 RepID=UPI003BF32F1C